MIEVKLHSTDRLAFMASDVDAKKFGNKKIKNKIQTASGIAKIEMKNGNTIYYMSEERHKNWCHGRTYKMNGKYYYSETPLKHKPRNKVTFNAFKEFNTLYLIPEIKLVINMPQYMCRSLSIELHFLGWHCRWLIMEGE